MVRRILPSYRFEPHDGQPRLETFLQRVHPEDRAKVRETVAGPGKVDYELDYRIVHPGGEIRHLLTVGHPVFSPSGDLIEFVGTVMDVTERKLSETLLSSEKHIFEMIAGGAPLPAVLNDLCSAIDEQSPGLISTVLVLDADGQRLWPVAGPAVPQGWTRSACRTRAPDSKLSKRTVSSRRSIPRNRRGWEWGWPLAAPSSKLMAVVCGPSQTKGSERLFCSACRSPATPHHERGQAHRIYR
jgi:hypothetical protein